MIKKFNFNYILGILISFLLLELTYISTYSAFPASNLSFAVISPIENNKISPLTGKVLSSDNREPTEAIYYPKNANGFLSGLNKADIVFEFINEKGGLTYNAIFHDNIPTKADIPDKVENIKLDKLPALTFSEFLWNEYNNKNKANFIFITLSYNIFSNFIYEDGYYIHYRDCTTDIDSSSNTPISVSNIIVQYVKSSDTEKSSKATGRGKGLLFCGGRVVDIEWNNNGSNPIKIEDQAGNPVVLIRGKTWWVTIDENCPVAFN